MAPVSTAELLEQINAAWRPIRAAASAATPKKLEHPPRRAANVTRGEITVMAAVWRNVPGQYRESANLLFAPRKIRYSVYRATTVPRAYSTSRCRNAIILKTAAPIRLAS